VVPCGFTPADDSATTTSSSGGQQQQQQQQQQPQQQVLPVGMQLVGRMFGEAQLLRVAHVYEQTAGVAGSRQPQVVAGAAAAAAGSREQLVAAQ
jgi:hypothetical protein